MLEGNAHLPSNQHLVRTRITSRDLFGLPRSATSEEAIAILKAKEDERLVVVVAAAGKKKSAKDKKARETAVLVTKGSSLLLRIQ